jgi:GT2 family glycosyltransferase
VNYNDYARSKEAIRSIIEQTRGIKYQIYMIDNASSDGSAERLAGEFPSISVVFCDRNLGYGAANNLVIRRIDSEYHAVINPDIVIKSNVLRQLYDFMERRQDVGVCMPAIRYMDGSPQYLPKRDPKLKYLIANRSPVKSKKVEMRRRYYKMMDEPQDKVMDIEFVSGCFMFVRTNLLKEARGFDERFFMYFEDADLTRTIRKRARAVAVPDAIAYHDYARQSAKKIKFLFIHIMSMFQYFFKWRKDEKPCMKEGEST